MKISPKEIRELKEAIAITKRVDMKLKVMVGIAEGNLDIKDGELWDLKNEATQISVVLYNIHHGVYRRSEAVTP